MNESFEDTLEIQDSTKMEKLKQSLNGLHFECQKCNLGFKTIAEMKNHSENDHKANVGLQESSNELDLKDKTYNETFKSVKKDIKDNFENVHEMNMQENTTSPLEIRKYKCNQCFKYFKINKHLNRHIQSVHLDIREHKCNECQKMFKSSNSVREHIQNVHLNIKKYKCNYCDKKYKSNNMLREHMLNTHNESRDFECEQCKKTFKSRLRMKKHIQRVHKTTYEFKCSQCIKAFKTRENLAEHVKCVHQNIYKKLYLLRLWKGF